MFRCCLCPLVVAAMALSAAPAAASELPLVQLIEGAQAPRAKATARKAEPARPAADEHLTTAAGKTYITFEGSKLDGQLNKSGAVMLQQREEVPLRSMVRQRTSFRDQIVKDVLADPSGG